ncbi:hypothetical protein BLOT_003536 [Blomia tropicalis]|nr:hypothetical protein BLOT_003536 [Blomia tropicalis]
MIVIRVNSLSDVNTTLLAMTEFLQEVVSILNLSFSSLFRSLDNQKLILWYRRMNERTNERTPNLWAKSCRRYKSKIENCQVSITFNNK